MEITCPAPNYLEMEKSIRIDEDPINDIIFGPDNHTLFAISKTKVFVLSQKTKKVKKTIECDISNDRYVAIAVQEKENSYFINRNQVQLATDSGFLQIVQLNSGKTLSTYVCVGLLIFCL